MDTRRDSLRTAVLGLWPGAPIAAESDTDRWLRFDPYPLGVVYLQRYRWRPSSVCHFLVASCDRDGRVRQEKHTTLAEAVAALRRLIPPRGGLPLNLGPPPRAGVEVRR